jgi:hypothetical protein
MERPPAKLPYRVRYCGVKLIKICSGDQGGMNSRTGQTQINELCSIILDLSADFLLLKPGSCKFA